MCEDDALDRLLSMNFRGLVEEVEHRFRSRRATLTRALLRTGRIFCTLSIFSVVIIRKVCMESMANFIA